MAKPIDRDMVYVLLVWELPHTYYRPRFVEVKVPAGEEPNRIEAKLQRQFGDGVMLRHALVPPEKVPVAKKIMCSHENLKAGDCQ